MGSSLRPGTELRGVSLDDKYLAESGHVFLTGVQALVRLPLMQKRLDARRGWNTAGYISGYRGSPLGTYDDHLKKAGRLLKENDVVFQPGVNEDLAATAVWGSQQAQAVNNEGKYDGVFAIWYGKGPGVDRSGDAFRHANLAGTAQRGGVLLLMGDDHTCESSTTCHQSEFALVDAMIPVLSPASVQEILHFGLAGWAMSRHSGLWVGLKCVKDIADATAVVDVAAVSEDFVADGSGLPPDGLNLRQPDTPHAQEHRLHNFKLDAARRFCLDNRLDRMNRPQDAWLGIATHGKSYLDLLQALDELGLTPAGVADLGVAIHKVGMVWPLEPTQAVAFARGLEKLIVIEEKRSLLETQFRELLYDIPQRPSIIGKRDERGAKLFQAELALDSVQIAVALGRRILERHDDPALRERVARLETRRTPVGVIDVMQRSFFFCSGCPHNTSTRIPQGSRAYAGIGCSWMAQTMDRSTLGYTQMGAEGMSWVGEAPFSRRDHVFQNMGDGTYFHSGVLAVRAAVAAKTNITFKILFNDAVAMTGGQRHDGPLTPQTITWQVFAEGVARIAVLTDDPGKYRRGVLARLRGGVGRNPVHLETFAPGVTVHHRDELDAIQKMLREIRGTTVLVYDQTCAAEKRRRRKRGALEDPPKRMFIHEQVCEGCGDCGAQSNCVSLQPLETEFGRKRVIDQSSCNKDYSCVKGFCPSFVTVEGGTYRPAQSGTASPLVDVPEPRLPELQGTYSLLVAGMGGTGVVTVGAVLGMAAHLEGKGCGILDMAGLAQKGGSVWSHLRIARRPEDIKAIRIAPGGADVVIGCDLIVSAAGKTLGLARAGAQVVVNTHKTMPGAFALDPGLKFETDPMLRNIQRVVGAENVRTIDATALTTRHLGDAIATNMFMLGYSYQLGLLPVSSAAIRRAIEINGAAVRMNIEAFELGRCAAVSSIPLSADGAGVPDTCDLDRLVSRRAEFLTGYQDAAYAHRYSKLVEEVRAFEVQHFPGETGLGEAVARSYFKLLAYKDEYEVARLYSGTDFLERVRRDFEGKVRVSFNLAPPLLARSRRGQLGRKHEFGPWIGHLFPLLAKMKRLRGTPLDPFGYTQERRQERGMIARYEMNVALVLAKVDAQSHGRAVELLSVPDQVRGFGHVKQASLNKVKLRWAELENFFAKQDSHA